MRPRHVEGSMISSCILQLDSTPLFVLILTPFRLDPANFRSTLVPDDGWLTGNGCESWTTVEGNAGLCFCFCPVRMDCAVEGLLFGPGPWKPSMQGMAEMRVLVAGRGAAMERWSQVRRLICTVLTVAVWPPKRQSRGSREPDKRCAHPR